MQLTFVGRMTGLLRNLNPRHSEERQAPPLQEAALNGGRKA